MTVDTTYLNNDRLPGMGLLLLLIVELQVVFCQRRRRSELTGRAGDVALWRLNDVVDRTTVVTSARIDMVGVAVARIGGLPASLSKPLNGIEHYQQGLMRTDGPWGFHGDCNVVAT